MYLSLEELSERTKFAKNNLAPAIKMIAPCTCGNYTVMPINHHTRYIECMSCGIWIEVNLFED